MVASIKLKEAEVDIRFRDSDDPLRCRCPSSLRQDSGLLGMRDLGMADRELNLFEEVLGIPHGIVLVTGPTGSGKTTSLYTALNAINDSERKIITVEDPVEYQMKGVNQIQVSESRFDLARGLRAIFRHDRCRWGDPGSGNRPDCRSSRLPAIWFSLITHE